MIEVFITKNGEPVGHIEIVNDSKYNDYSSNNDELGDYRVKIAVERGTAVGVYQRKIKRFPRKKYNVLALVNQALNTLDVRDLKLEPGYDIDSQEAFVSADLARKLSGTLRQIQARVGRLHRD